MLSFNPDDNLRCPPKCLVELLDMFYLKTLEYDNLLIADIEIEQIVFYLVIII